jgi:hypothetical protein
MEEEQVEREVPVTHLQGIFRADEAKVSAQLDQKLLQLFQEGALQVGFRVGLRKSKEFHGGSVPKNV